MTVHKTIERPEPKLVAECRDLPPASLHEAMGRRGAMPAAIKPLYSGMKACGPAITVACRPGDNLVVGGDDGVVVVPRDEVATVLAAARERERHEEVLREQLRAGETTVELLNLGDALRSAGII